MTSLLEQCYLANRMYIFAKKNILQNIFFYRFEATFIFFSVRGKAPVVPFDKLGDTAISAFAVCTS